MLLGVSRRPRPRNFRSSSGPARDLRHSHSRPVSAHSGPRRQPPDRLSQRHDVANTFVPVAACHRIHLFPRRVHAGEMSRRTQRRLLEDARDRGVGALARRTAGAIGDGHELGARAAPSRLMASQRFSSILSVLGGKNSNETAISPAPSSLFFFSPVIVAVIGASIRVDGFLPMSVRQRPRRGRQAKAKP